MPFTVVSFLSDWEDEEVAELFVGGRSIAKLRTTRTDQKDEQTIDAPAGVYEYDLSVQYWYTDSGKSLTNAASGQGRMIVTRGVTFQVSFSNGVASLREVT